MLLYFLADFEQVFHNVLIRHKLIHHKFLFTIETVFSTNILNKSYALFLYFSLREETKILVETNFRSFVFYLPFKIFLSAEFNIFHQ